jgi:hypothetical protein
MKGESPYGAMLRAFMQVRRWKMLCENAGENEDESQRENAKGHRGR